MARHFDGTNDWLVKSSISGGLPTAYPITVLARAWKDTTGTDDQQIFDVGDGSSTDTNFFSLQLIGSASNVVARCAIIDNSSNTGIVVGTSNLSINTVYALAAVYRGATDREVYVDGVSDGTNTTPSVSFPIGLDQIHIGRHGGTAPGVEYDGRIFDVALYNVELTLNEIKAYANGVSASMIRPSAIMGFWPLYGTSPEVDLSGNGHNLTVTGSPTIENGYAVGRYNPQPLTSFRHVRDTREAIILDRLTPA